MDIKDYVSITLSVLALGLGVFNLWWGTFRRRIALFFIQSPADWSYTLVNGGKTDVLILYVGYWFQGTTDSTSSPNQECSETLPVLLKAGAAVHQKVTFPNQQQEFAFMAKEEGRDSGEKGKTLTAIANISWVDNNGDEHSAEVPVMDVAISDGWVRAWWILNSKANLSPSRFGRKEATHLARLKDLRSRFKSK